SCSCASGPAFEGAHIRHGMRAAGGAVEGVILQDNRALVSIIDGKPALGLCGSGILDAVAELQKAGILDRRGNFVQDVPALIGEGPAKAFILVPAKESGTGQDIAIGRKDINEVQLAKAAIRTGIDLLLHKVNLDAESLDSVIIAGAFGSYLNLESAIRIGLLPDLPIEKFRQVGNAAGAGARAMLLSQKKRKEAGVIARKCEFVELNLQPDFKRVFMKNMYLTSTAKTQRRGV
ncbi:MAG: ATP-binding protein, partial [bacterium]|nr:ATP-binding protein [bacterium]